MIEQIMEFLYKDRKSYKGTKIVYDLLKHNKEFREIIINGIKSNQISGFSDEIWDAIEKQNIRRIRSFIDVFIDGANLGYCTVASKQLSYSFDSCYIVGGINKYLKGTTNSSDGSHTWIERNGIIYDTTFMLAIDKSYAIKMGYSEENRNNPNLDPIYRSAKEFTNDCNIR